MRTDFATLLRGVGLRVTPQRLVILEVASELGDHSSAEDVFNSLAPRFPEINLSTVYRSLTEFEQKHLLRRTDLGTGKIVFHFPGEGEHHHLVCHNCGLVMEISTKDLVPLVEQCRAHYGFSVDLPHQVLSGHCAKCLTPTQSE